jgi:Tfp pilus assembly protein PilF
VKAGDLDAARADFDKALLIDPKNAESLYGRGLLKRRQGDGPGGEADINAASMLQAGIDKEAESRGITP